MKSKIIVNVKINLTFTIIILFILPCTSDDCVISVQIGTGKRNLFIAFTIKSYGVPEALWLFYDLIAAGAHFTVSDHLPY